MNKRRKNKTASGRKQSLVKIVKMRPGMLI
ncbi:hypothetical protein SAMN05216521_10601, partial [Enterocloster clostridioformis]